MTMKVGQRLLWSIEQNKHGEVATQRVEDFLAYSRQNKGN